MAGEEAEREPDAGRGRGVRGHPVDGDSRQDSERREGRRRWAPPPGIRQPRPHRDPEHAEAPADPEDGQRLRGRHLQVVDHVVDVPGERRRDGDGAQRSRDEQPDRAPAVAAARPSSRARSKRRVSGRRPRSQGSASTGSAATAHTTRQLPGTPSRAVTISRGSAEPSIPAKPNQACPEAREPSAISSATTTAASAIRVPFSAMTATCAAAKLSSPAARALPRLAMGSSAMQASSTRRRPRRSARRARPKVPKAPSATAHAHERYASDPAWPS